MFMGPMMNKRSGALGGPQKLNVLRQDIDVQVAPVDIGSPRRWPHLAR